MAARQAVLDPESEPAAHLSSRFEPRDHGAASRQAALRLARDARALPRDERWLYLRTLRSVARQAGLAGLEGLQLDKSALLDAPSDGSATGDALGLDMPGEENGSRPASGTSRRVLPAFALTGLLAGMAAAVMLPASLSERLPGTSGNDREPLAAQPSDPRADVGSSVGGDPRAGGSGSSGHSSTAKGSSVSRAQQRERTSSGRHRAPARRRLAGAGGVSGEGNRRIGTVRVDRPTRLRWRAGGGSFAIVSEAWRFRPGSNSGTTVLTPGTYRRLSVRSTGRWTLKLVAGS